MAFDFEKYLINSELGQFSRYVNIVNRSLSQEIEKVNQEYKSDLEHNSQENDEAYELMVSLYENQFVEFDLEFPKLIFGSFIVAWYSFVEQKLLDFCEKQNLRISISAKEGLNLGKGIWRAKKFLLDASNYKIEDKFWIELANANRLRNFIVHEGYTYKGSYTEIEKPFVLYQLNAGETIYFNVDENLYKYIHQHSMATHIGSTLYIVPTFEYCEHLIGFAKLLFNTLIDESRLPKK